MLINCELVGDLVLVTSAFYDIVDINPRNVFLLVYLCPQIEDWALLRHNFLATYAMVRVLSSIFEGLVMVTKMLLSTWFIQITFGANHITLMII